MPAVQQHHQTYQLKICLGEQGLNTSISKFRDSKVLLQRSATRIVSETAVQWVIIKQEDEVTFWLGTLLSLYSQPYNPMETITFNKKYCYFLLSGWAIRSVST